MTDHDSWAFLREAARDPRTTGAVAPSGRALARALTEPVRARAPRPLSVLEVGAGTGAVTRVLAADLPRGSRLDLVEANPRFAARLRALPGLPPHTTVHEQRIEDLDTDERYDVIISGLPLTNFAPSDVDKIMSRLLELLHPGGTLTYFAYLGTRRARTLTSSRTEARRHAEVDDVLTTYQRRHAVGRWTVWANLPPAYTWQLRREVVR
ncbi:methyltransferase domain-containing protein [Streptomyces roseirectus]|uniref:Methyltransferase domain-containing protein n=1 Tax=Streptomyces roseirectus TaxID=2768066 RepID=A0A7H0I756_9ACTN|nr:methyltransferase domain-containing protein [Streptomyces roseirectus]QNP68622.1 methyltransferase domain-containing protein [Streptomyces roseirectus]